MISANFNIKKTLYSSLHSSILILK